MSLNQKILENLRDEIHMHTHLYYVKDAPIISDYEFDLIVKKINWSWIKISTIFWY